MFFFPGNCCPASAMANKNSPFVDSWTFDWESLTNSETLSFISLDEFLFTRKSRFKINFVASFASLIEFYFSCLLITFLKTQAIFEFLRNTIKDLIKVFQNQVFVHFIEQARIKDKVKSLFIPIKILLDSLRPIKITA